MKGEFLIILLNGCSIILDFQSIKVEEKHFVNIGNQEIKEISKGRKVK